MKDEITQFRIGQLAQKVGVERFVIRFWEKEFNLKASRTVGGQRFYTTRDLGQFKQIKDLLHERGFTIAGAKQQLRTGQRGHNPQPNRLQALMHIRKKLVELQKIL
jgi:DNA-binding transcriptional MerR regulator